MFPLNPKSHVRARKTAEIVAGRIRRAIVQGSIGPGESLPSEAELIQMFEVSRPTIREAIRILEFENLISVLRGARGGARVQPRSFAFVSWSMGVALQARGATLGDVYAARSMIEPLAARLAAQNRPAEASAALRTHVRVQRQSLEAPVEVTRAAADFHRVLMEQCGSQTFALIGVALHDLVATHQALAHRRNQAELEATLKLSRTGIRSRERLADFIGSGEAEQAESHWRSHMTNAGRFLLKDLADTAVVDILEGKL